jgi:hypothetical protein
MLHDRTTAFDDDPLSAHPAFAARRQLQFKLVPFREIKLSSSAVYLVKNLIPREGLIVIWGAPKCGKTFWAFDLGMHIALGWEYRGRRVKRGTVVYIACEGERGLTARAEAFRQRKMAEDEANAPFHLLATRLDLAGEVAALIADITAQIGADDCSAIFIDTLNRSIAGSESDDRDMGDYVKAADKLRERFKCAIVIIHHCGIVDRRPRGHTSLTGAADAQIAVKRDTTGRVITTVEFMKDGAEGDETTSRLEVVEVGEDEDGEPITSCVVIEVESVASKRPAKTPALTPSQRRALDLLAEAINKAGKVPPRCDHIPSHMPCVEEGLWRQYCYAGQIADSDKPGAKQKAFKRAAEKLLADGYVGRWTGLVWIVPATGP